MKPCQIFQNVVSPKATQNRFAPDWVAGITGIRIWLALDVIHAAPPWLWPALVTKMLADSWTVEETRREVKRVQQAEEPPHWAHTEDIATALVDGTLKLPMLPRFARCVEESMARIARAEDDATRFTTLLARRLSTSSAPRL